jgi:hypothetical protein
MMAEKYSSLVLPSDFFEMEKLIKSNKIKLMDQIVSSIGYAINNNLQAVEVFNFEESDYIVVLDHTSFEENLENIYDFYISQELYENCSKILSLKQKLNKKHEQKKRHESKGTSKRKN